MTAEHRVDCPVRGKKFDCTKCEFYDCIPADPEQRECRYKITNLMLNDVANYLQAILRSTEGHRALQSEVVSSGIQRAPTETLLRLIGLEKKDG